MTLALVPAAGRAAMLDAELRDAAAEMVRGARRAIPLMAEMRAHAMHLELGWGSWHGYIADVFGDLRDLRLNGSDEAVTERRALVGSMVDDGLSITDIQRKLDYSRGTVAGDRRAHLGKDEGESLRVLDVDEGIAPDPYAGMSRTRETLARVAAQQDRGLTSLELDAETGWPMGTATANLSKLERRGQVIRVATFRRNRAAYVVTDLGRTILEEQQ
jgi:hypothetical protein